MVSVSGATYGACSLAAFTDGRDPRHPPLSPTTVYAHLQAAGHVNDHLIDCFRHDAVGA